MSLEVLSTGGMVDNLAIIGAVSSLLSVQAALQKATIKHGCLRRTVECIHL